MNHIRAGLRLAKDKKRSRAKQKEVNLHLQGSTAEELEKAQIKARTDCFINGHQWYLVPALGTTVCIRCGRKPEDITAEEIVERQALIDRLRAAGF